MSSLPLISHHLFVAAAGHEGRDQEKPKQNQPDQEWLAEGSASTQMHSGELAGEAPDHLPGVEVELSRH